MNRIFIQIISLIVSLIIIHACYDDNGTYDYLTEEEVGIIEIDTTGMENRWAFANAYSPGDTIKMSPKVKYPHPENLNYAWIAIPYPYNEIKEGNSTRYPTPDTLSRTLEIEWIVDLPPGNYSSFLVVTDEQRGLSATMKMQEVFFTVSKPGTLPGVYVLSEYDGNTDIDYYSSSLCLVYGGDRFIPQYYSKELKKEMLSGKPLFISGGKDYYYVFTENEGYRFNTSGLELMETFNEMFYSAPVYKPQKLNYINNCEFLINDGKLHVLYTNRANDRKFSAPIGGNYIATSFLSDETKSSYRPVQGAINADQVIFDEMSNGFRPYFPLSTEISEFKTTSDEAIIDVKNLPAKPIAISGGSGGKTYAILIVEDIPYLYIMNFNNVVDNGDLSGDGANSIIDLSGCKDITNLKYFVANYNGTALYYATDKAVYSFSPSTGQTTQETIYECEDNEIVTSIDLMFGNQGGGFPTAGCIFWIGVWNETANEGKLIEYEVDPFSGKPRWNWGSMFAPEHSNPHITTGFGKIKSIIARV